MVLDNDADLLEMYLHCKKTLADRAKMLRVIVPYGSSAFPIIKKRSVLHLKSVFKPVNTFPIDEDDVVSDDIGVGRPLYYCELYSKALNDLKGRRRMQRKLEKRF